MTRCGKGTTNDKTMTGPLILVPGPLILVPGALILVPGPLILVPGPLILVPGPLILVPGPLILVSGRGAIIFKSSLVAKSCELFPTQIAPRPLQNSDYGLS